MSASPKPSPESTSLVLFETARALAVRGWPVLPCCWPDEHGACACPGTKEGPHQGRDIGKAPIGRLVPRGCRDATTDQRTVWKWWAAYPLANVAANLERSGLVFVDPDSPEALAEAGALGLPPTIARVSRNPGYLYLRPAGCPIGSTTRRGTSGKLDILAQGYAIVAGRHASGCPVYLEDLGELPPAPAWAVEMLRAAEAARAANDGAVSEDGEAEPPVRLGPAGLQRWRGEVVELDIDGALDRSRSLWHLGLDLAAANASIRAIAGALEERDAALGWAKYTGRGDRAARYAEIAREAVAWAERVGAGRPHTGRARRRIAEIVVRVAS